MCVTECYSGRVQLGLSYTRGEAHLSRSSNTLQHLKHHLSHTQENTHKLPHRRTHTHTSTRAIHERVWETHGNILLGASPYTPAPPSPKLQMYNYRPSASHTHT